MALQGTIKDFGLADIFQLIGIQRKTGVLTLENDEDTVTVSFLDGQVVAADTRLRNLEDLLGSVLVRTGRITEAQLREALKIQKNTLQRLGYILVNSSFISDQDLAEALRIQITQIVYRLFRWKDGKYHFDAVDEVEYDREHFTPIAAETILMEGARMIDEWPIIERRIKSDQIVFKKTDAGEAIDVPVESLVEAELDFGFGGGAEGSEESQKESEIKLTSEEREILRMADGRANVQEIVDRSALGEFDTYRVLYELLTRNLIEEVKAAPVGTGGPVRSSSRLVGALVLAVLLVFAVLSIATLNLNPVTPWKLGSEQDATDRLRTYASRIRLERIERAIRVFYLDTGAVPDRLDLLAKSGYLEARDLVDPWGRSYGYQLGQGSFRLVGRGPSGAPRDDLTVSRRFSASQRMLLNGSATEE